MPGYRRRRNQRLRRHGRTPIRRAHSTEPPWWYALLDARDFEGAWQHLAPPLQQQLATFAEWKAGYATTVSTEVLRATALSADRRSATVEVSLRATDEDACGDSPTGRFNGAWTLTHEEDRWKASSVNVRRTAGEAPITDADDCPETATAAGDDCYPSLTLPAVEIPAVPELGIPPETIPEETIPGDCIDAPDGFELEATTLASAEDYVGIDPDYSPALTSTYWRDVGESSLVPDHSAAGFGRVNAAGYPRNQYVRAYLRSDGTFVSGYWRNSPSDGLSTCQVINC